MSVETRGNIVSAVFDTYSSAERAASDLRAAGVSDTNISVIAKEGSDYTTRDAAGRDVDHDVDGTGAVAGALGGAGVGALLGIAALAIPGVGPFVAAGAIAQSAIGGAAVAGAAVGATAGGLAGALTEYGVDEDDASYYEDRINNGGVFVSVDLRNPSVDRSTALGILKQAGGHAPSWQAESHL